MADKLQGIQGMTPAMKAFVSMTRLAVRDFPELNRLVAGEESSDRFVAWAVLDAISRFNGTPHFTMFSLEDLLFRNQAHLLTRMTIESLLESIGLLQTRNHINYSNGGVNVGVNDKTPLIMNWLQYFKSTTEQRLQQVKVALNIESILGPSNSGVHSEYWAVNATYLSY
jgi:hypothetical protein